MYSVCLVQVLLGGVYEIIIWHRCCVGGGYMYVCILGRSVVVVMHMYLV